MARAPRILIVGYGRLGDALARVIAPSQRSEIALFDTDTSKVPQGVTLPSLTTNANFVFLCTPASAVAESLSAMREALKPHTTIVSFIKGLDPATGKSIAELCEELLPEKVNYAIIGGPMLSAELQPGGVAAATVGSQGPVFKKVQTLFAPTILKLTHSSDAQGVAVAGVLKNIYALGLGIASACGYGDNVRGWLMQQAVSEMRELLPLLAGKAKTVDTLAGIGDLVATGTSQHSRNRTVGHELVQSGQVSIPSEGYLTLPILLKRLENKADNLPFFMAVKNVVIDKADAKQVFKQLLVS